MNLRLRKPTNKEENQSGGGGGGRGSSRKGAVPSEALIHFNHPALMIYIYFVLKIFKPCNLGYDMISNFHLQGRTTSPFAEVTFHILRLGFTQAETIRF